MQFNSFQRLATLVTASALPTIPNGAVEAHVTAVGGDVRYRRDGTDPTTASGMILKDGELRVFRWNLDELRFIRDGIMQTPTLEVEYMT